MISDKEPTMDKPELKPCPFCGGNAEISNLDGVVENGHRLRFAACSSEDCRASLWCEDEEDAIKRWNHRAGE